MTEKAPVRLERSLSLWQVTLSGIGIVIGAGIYVLIGSAAEEAGNAVWLAFVLAALMSALTGLSYAELASMYPSAAAEYEFARQAFNEFTGFIAGWTMLAAYVIAAAAVAIGFGHYLRYFVEVEYQVAAIGLLVVLTAVVVSGVQRSIWLSVALVLLQVSGLALVIIAGAPHIGSRDLLAGASVTGVLSGSALVFFAFIGFDDIITLAEDTRDPRRSMPRALLLALGISTLLYILVGLSAVSVVGGEALAGSPQPLADVMAHNWGAEAADIVASIALACTVNTTLLILTAASRIVYGMASRGSLPGQLATVGRRGRAPYVAAVAVLLASAGFALIGDIGFVAAATDFAVYVVFILANGSLIALRYRQPEARRGFKVPGSFGRLAVTPLLAVAAVLLMIAFLAPKAWLVGAAIIALGVPAWKSSQMVRAASAGNRFRSDP